ncbi:hypothetical protein RYA05_04395 [Pseudomonas syringae pv. actinidiae]|nr:hypothetical protein [Pseudomonas syringae pv. actinidiae]
MFQGLYFCRQDENSSCCDYVVEGVYFTFVFRDGRCFEWNEERE